MMPIFMDKLCPPHSGADAILPFPLVQSASRAAFFVLPKAYIFCTSFFFVMPENKNKPSEDLNVKAL